MSVIVRCRRCGAPIVADRFDILVRARRLCPNCRGPLPPTGGSVVSSRGWPVLCPPEAA